MPIPVMPMGVLVIGAIVLIGLIWAMFHSSVSIGQWLLIVVVAVLTSGAVVAGFMAVSGGSDMDRMGPGPGITPDRSVQPLPGEQVTVGGLGIVLCNATVPGAFVLDVLDQSEADRFGFSAGEIITHIDDQPIETIDDAVKMLTGMKGGNVLSVSVMSSDGMSGWAGSLTLENDITIER